MKLSQIIPHLNYKFLSENDLIKAIQEVSINFTQNRQDIQDYLSDPRLSSAYTAFYLTTNIPKLEGVFKWMDQAWLEELKECIFFDIGSGPGTFSFAFRKWAGQSVSIFQIENSALMKDQAKKIWDGLYPGEELHQHLLSKNEFTKKKFMLFGHSANEMEFHTIMKYIEEIQPDHILFIEPGTKDVFSLMLRIREKLISKGFEILFPCMESTTCPMSGQSLDWCHQFLYVNHDPEVERLSQMVKKDRRLLPITVHAYSLKKIIGFDGARVVRVFPETKFSFEWQVCDNNVIHRYQVMKRGLSKYNLDLFSHVKSGDLVYVEIEKIMDQQERVKVKALNNNPIEP